MKTEIEKLKNKADKIRLQIRKLKRKEELQRQKETLEKEKIVGRIFLEKYNNDTEELKRIIDPLIKIKTERELFDLEPLKKEKGET